MKPVSHYLQEVTEQPHEVLDTFLLALSPRRKARLDEQVPWAADWLLRKGLVKAVFTKPERRSITVHLEPTDLGRAVGDLITAI